MKQLFWCYFRSHYHPLVISQVKESENVNDFKEMVQPFYQILNKYLLIQGISKRQIPSASGIDRRTVYKIYHDPDYTPTKRLVLCLGLGLRLERELFDSFLHDCGYHLSEHFARDVVIAYCIKERIYELTQVNIYLEKVGESPLGGCVF